MEPYVTDGHASLAIRIEDLHHGYEMKNTSRYVRPYFSLRNTVNDTEVFLKPALCRDVFDAPDSFWTDFEEDTNQPVDELYCPDLESVEYSPYQFIIAYISSCNDTLSVLGIGDPSTDCETDKEEVQFYLDNEIDVYSVWISEYFDL